MNDFEVGRLSGLLEADGWFCLSMHNRNPKHLYPHIGIEMVDLDTLEWCREVTGEGNIYGPRVRKDTRPQAKSERQPTWTWKIGKKQVCIDLMKQLYPHMSARRRSQIDNVLAQLKESSS